ARGTIFKRLRVLPWHTSILSLQDGTKPRTVQAMTQLIDVLDQISGFVWGPFLLIPLLLGVGLYLTFRLGGVQFVKLIPALKLGILKRKDPGSKGDISQFQALTTALAATVGTG